MHIEGYYCTIYIEVELHYSPELLRLQPVAAAVTIVAYMKLER